MASTGAAAKGDAKVAWVRARQAREEDGRVKEEVMEEEGDGETVAAVTAAAAAAATGRRGGFELCTTAPTILTAAAAAGEEGHPEEETKLEEASLVVENLEADGKPPTGSVAPRRGGAWVATQGYASTLCCRFNSKFLFAVHNEMRSRRYF